MTRVLWDTSVVLHWLRDEPNFRPGIEKALSRFGEGRSFYVSTVTTLELLVWAAPEGRAESTYAFIAEHFAPLDFTQACAVETARLVAVARARNPDGDVDAHDALRCHRDASIIATASSHQLDVLFTAAEDAFAPFASHVSCRIVAPASIRS